MNSNEMILYMALMVYVSCVSGGPTEGRPPVSDDSCTCAVRLDKILRRVLNLCNQMYHPDERMGYIYTSSIYRCDRVVCSWHKIRAGIFSLLYQRYIINRRNAFGLARGWSLILMRKRGAIIRSPCDVAPVFWYFEKFEKIQK